jgi:hypothetical protein
VSLFVVGQAVLWGVAGMILAVPLIAVLRIVMGTVDKRCISICVDAFMDGLMDASMGGWVGG